MKNYYTTDKETMVELPEGVEPPKMPYAIEGTSTMIGYDKALIEFERLIASLPAIIRKDNGLWKEETVVPGDQVYIDYDASNAYSSDEVLVLAYPKQQEKRQQAGGERLPVGNGNDAYCLIGKVSNVIAHLNTMIHHLSLGANEESIRLAHKSAAEYFEYLNKAMRN